MRGFGLVSLLIGFIILIVVVTSAMNMTVNQLKTRDDNGGRYYHEEKVDQVEEIYNRSREMQNEQIENYENDDWSDDEYQDENYYENNDDKYYQDNIQSQKRSRLAGQQEFAESMEIETSEDQERSLEDLQDKYKKEQFIEIIEQEFKDTGNMVEVH